MNNGIYVEDTLLNADKTNFCVGVGGYPEKHFESPNIDTDIKYAKEKINAGAEYIVTQMFFDNKHYYDYVERCREAGIDVPIIPGLKMLNSKNQLTSLPKNFHIDLPTELVNEISEAKNEHILEIGVNWTAKQVEDLLNNSSPAIHFYIMQNSNPINLLMKKLNL
jgi:methylenetetrahydrofolate reductase (NADPH)